MGSDDWPAPVVVKVGGSLFDLPDLGTRLRRFLRQLAAPHMALVPGGGRIADVVRGLDRCHGLGEEAAHWLALRALTVNAWLLASLLSPPQPPVVGGWQEGTVPWRGEVPVILDAYRFLEADEGRPGALPHTWHVTSDAVAARLAVVAGARRLFLLKSVAIPPGLDWGEAGRRGFVDTHFAQVIAAAPGIEVRSVNLRASQP
jgi:aspartokinase-like uncharacterized kinase